VPFEFLHFFQSNSFLLCTQDPLEKIRLHSFSTVDSRNAVSSHCFLRMLRNEPSINLEMDHPVLQSTLSRSPRPIERVDLKVLLREEGTAHVEYRCQVCEFSLRDSSDVPVRGDGAMRLFFSGDICAGGVTCVPVK